MTGRAVSGSQGFDAASGQRAARPTGIGAYLIKLSRVAVGLLVVVACYLSGEWFADILSIPVPGSVLGMVLLFLVLCVQPVRLSDRFVVPVAERLVALIPFLLVPAAVGVVAHLVVIARDAGALLTAIVGGWAVTLVVTAHAAKLLLRRANKKF